MNPAGPSPVDARHGVIIPTYNSGPLLAETVREVLAFCRTVIVVVDGSTDGSAEPVLAMALGEPGLQVLISEKNQGKGTAIASGLRLAADSGLTHAATFDADGQHHAPDLPRFVEASRENPEAMILGQPVFGDEAPLIRILGHRVSNFFTALETCLGGIADSLCGFRVYPVVPALEVLRATRGARGFDVETQLAVHLRRRGIPAINIPTAVRYRTRAAGGISHYRYVRDNLVMVRAHAILLAGAPFACPRLMAGHAGRLFARFKRTQPKES